MKPFEPATVRPFTEAQKADFRLLARERGVSYSQLLSVIKLDQERTPILKNDTHQVAVYEEPDGWTHLSIKRIDRGTQRDWREMQEIKNLIVGPEREAVELYPAESRLVDTANQYHLWCGPPGFRFPLGFTGERFVRDEVGLQSVEQRPFEEPVDA